MSPKDVAGVFATTPERGVVVYVRKMFATPETAVRWVQVLGQLLGVEG